MGRICLQRDVLNRLQVIHGFANIEFEILKGDLKPCLAVAAVNFCFLGIGNFFKHVYLGVQHLLPLSIDFSEFIRLQPEDLRDYFKSFTQRALELRLGLLRFWRGVFGTNNLRRPYTDVRVDSVNESPNQIVHGCNV